MKGKIFFTPTDLTAQNQPMTRGVFAGLFFCTRKPQKRTCSLFGVLPIPATTHSTAEGAPCCIPSPFLDLPAPSLPNTVGFVTIRKKSSFTYKTWDLIFLGMGTDHCSGEKEETKRGLHLFVGAKDCSSVLDPWTCWRGKDIQSTRKK